MSQLRRDGEVEGPGRGGLFGWSQERRMLGLTEPVKEQKNSQTFYLQYLILLQLEACDLCHLCPHISYIVLLLLCSVLSQRQIYLDLSVGARSTVSLKWNDIFEPCESDVATCSLG